MWYRLSQWDNAGPSIGLDRALATATLALFMLACWAFAMAITARRRGRARAKVQGFARDAMRGAVHPSCPHDAMLLSQEGDGMGRG